MRNDANEWMAQPWLDHASSIHRFVTRRAPQLADDVTSETFLTAWNKIDDVPDDARPLLFVTARNILMTRTRGQQRYDVLLRQLQDMWTPAIEPDVAEHIDEQVAQRVAWITLTPTEREALVLVGWDGLSNAEAAAVAGCSQATFAVRLFRARQRLIRAHDHNQNGGQPEGAHHVRP